MLFKKKRNRELISFWCLFLYVSMENIIKQEGVDDRLVLSGCMESFFSRQMDSSQKLGLAESKNSDFSFFFARKHLPIDPFTLWMITEVSCCGMRFLSLIVMLYELVRDYRKLYLNSEIVPSCLSDC